LKLAVSLRTAQLSLEHTNFFFKKKKHVLRVLAISRHSHFSTSGRRANNAASDRVARPHFSPERPENDPKRAHFAKNNTMCLLFHAEKLFQGKTQYRERFSGSGDRCRSPRRIHGRAAALDRSKWLF
jgi:hypothetical protein